MFQILTETEEEVRRHVENEAAVAMHQLQRNFNEERLDILLDVEQLKGQSAAIDQVTILTALFFQSFRTPIKEHVIIEF